MLGTEVLKAALPGESYQLVELAADMETANVDELIAPGLEKLFRDLDYSKLAVDQARPFCLDLRRTPVGKEIERLAAKLRMGNEGEATLSRLTFNLHTGQVFAAIDLTARDRTSLQQAINLVGKSVNDLSDETVRNWKASLVDVEKLGARSARQPRKLPTIPPQSPMWEPNFRQL